MAISLPPKGEPEKRVGAHFAPLSVTQQEIPNMTAKVRSGSFFNTQDVFTEFSGGNTPAIVAPSSNAKWVLICATDAGTMQLVDGAVSASPTLPAVPANVLPLAAVYVTSTTAVITNTAIVDVRPFLRASNLVPDISAYATLTDLSNAVASKADVDGTNGNVFTLNKDQTGVPAADASLTVNRGASPAVAIRWNETLELWELTNDGTSYEPISSAASFAALVHTHTTADITNFVVATNAIVDAAIAADAAPTVHTHTLSAVTDVTASAADVNQLTGVDVAATYETIANVALKADKVGDVFTGTITVHEVGNQPISVVSSDAGSSGLMVDRGVDPAARMEWDNTAESWLIGTTGSMNTVLTGAVIDTKVDRSGDTMTGNLAMSNNKVTGLAAATANGDAVRYDELNSHTSDATIHFTQAAISITESQISDFGSYSPSTHDHDSDYVNVTGDTMTGNLVFTGGSHTVSQAQFVTLGDAQSRERAVYAETSTATVTELFTDGTGGIGRLVMADDTTWMFDVTVVARRTDVAGENAAYRFEGAIARDTGAASTAVVNVAETILAEDVPAWSVVVDADATNGALRVRVTGEAAKTVRWVAFVKTVEVSV